jgi:hypothetical protein
MTDLPGRPALRGCESLISESDELQWRQVHPRFVDGGVVSEQAFVGTPDDRECVSTSRESKTTAAEAHNHHSSVLGLSSAGTWAVSVTEIEGCLARAVDDDQCPDVETPAHSFIDLRGMTKPEKRRARAELAVAANSRGRQHPAT